MHPAPSRNKRDTWTAWLLMLPLLLWSFSVPALCSCGDHASEMHGDQAASAMLATQPTGTTCCSESGHDPAGACPCAEHSVVETATALQHGSPDLAESVRPPATVQMHSRRRPEFVNWFRSRVEASGPAVFLRFCAFRC